MIKNTASTTYDRRFLKIAKTYTMIQALEYILLKYFEEAPLNISLLILSPVLVSNDLRILLTETDIARSKSFLRSFIQKIVIHGDRGTIYSKLPVPTSWKETEDIVLPIVPFGGAEGIPFSFAQGKLTLTFPIGSGRYPMFCFEFDSWNLFAICYLVIRT